LHVRRRPITCQNLFDRVIRRPLVIVIAIHLRASMVPARGGALEAPVAEPERKRKIRIFDEHGLGVNLGADLQEAISTGGRCFQTPDLKPGSRRFALHVSAKDSCSPDDIVCRVGEIVHHLMFIHNTGTG